jgi:hypothetical protein
MRIIRQAGRLAGAIVAAALTTTALAQTGGAVSGTVRAGTRVTTAVPRVTVPVQSTVRATSGATVNGATRVTGAVRSSLRSAVSEGTRALLAGVTLTAAQHARIAAESQAYAGELEAAATARTEAGADGVASTADAASDAAREHARQAAARYRGEVRALLTSEQQATFDANVRAGATAEVDLRRHSASADGRAEADASASAGTHPVPTSERPESQGKPTQR